METADFRKHALVPKSKGARRNTRLPPIDPGLMPFILGKLAPEDRRALAYIVEYGDTLETAHGRYLLVPLKPVIEDALATFQAHAEDLEPEGDGCVVEDDMCPSNHLPGAEDDAEPCGDEEPEEYPRAELVAEHRAVLVADPNSGTASDWNCSERTSAQARLLVDIAALGRRRANVHRLNR